MSSLLLLFINFADDDPECEDADEGVLTTPLANTLRIGRTTLVSNDKSVNISRMLVCTEHCTVHNAGSQCYLASRRPRCVMRGCR